MTKKALISPGEVRTAITGWGNHVTPIVEQIENSARVAEVGTNTFPVAPPMFWVDCADDIVADECYYDLKSNTFKSFPETPVQPEAPQPEVQGAQTL